MCFTHLSLIVFLFTRCRQVAVLSIFGWYRSLFLAWGPLGGFGFNGHTGFFGKFFFRAPSAVNLPHSTSHSFTFSACNSLMAFHSNSILARSTFFLSLS